MAAALDFPKLLTREQAAEFLSIRPQTLAVWSVIAYDWDLEALGLER